MSDEEKKERDEEDEDEEEDDEELTDDERRKRRLKRLLEKQAEKDFKNGRKVDKGFEGAFGGQEGAHKYYRHHNFTFTAEPKDKPPEIKPSQVTGEYWKEKHLWYPEISHQTENPVKNDEKSHEEILPYDELERIEAEAKSEITEEDLARVEVEAKKVLESGLMSKIFREAVEEYKTEQHDEAGFYPEHSDITHPEKSRKLGHSIDRLDDGLGMY